jgi:hypothetical protein
MFRDEVEKVRTASIERLGVDVGIDACRGPLAGEQVAACCARGC